MARRARTRTATPLTVHSEQQTLVTVEVLSRETRLDPHVIRRFVALGLIERHGGTAAAPLFRSTDAQLLARAARLRSDLELNYAGAALASELLARIDELERALHERAAHEGEPGET